MTSSSQTKPQLVEDSVYPLILVDYCPCKVPPGPEHCSVCFRVWYFAQLRKAYPESENPADITCEIARNHIPLIARHFSLSKLKDGTPLAWNPALIHLAYCRACQIPFARKQDDIHGMGSNKRHQLEAMLLGPNGPSILELLTWYLNPYQEPA